MVLLQIIWKLNHHTMNILVEGVQEMNQHAWKK